MVSGKKQVRQARRMQTRTKTKGSRYTTLSDPTTNTTLLSTQLHALGLYAVETLGDGNCLFRALSDQLYGTPNYHYPLRSEICDWIALHKDRYEPFVEDDRGLEVHLCNMRQHGTYGGHLELSAFAHLKRRNVKVIQPGLVYVIEWNGGDVHGTVRDGHRRRAKAPVADQDEEEEEEQGAIYIAYHDWEHFSSIRNIAGPHQGLPHVVESSQPVAPATLLKSTKHTIRIRGTKPLAPSSSIDTMNTPPISIPVTIINAVDIELPPSPSPSSQDSSRLTSTSTSSLLTPDDSVQLHSASTIRYSRSPKRSLAESESRDDVPYSDKKQRQDRIRTLIDIEDEARSEPSSHRSTPASESRVSTPSRALSPLDSPVKSVIDGRPLTRRQRKALGLPKPRGPAAGKIVIPGGKHPKRQGKGWIIVSEDESEPTPPQPEEQEWVKNGTGRVDVRGFKELRI